MLYVIEENKTTSEWTLKSGAKITMDQFGNVWYKSDIDVVLGKVVGDKFTPLNGKDFNSDMLIGIAGIIDVGLHKDEIKK